MGMGGGADESDNKEGNEQKKRKKILRPPKITITETGPNLKLRPNPKNRKTQLKM